MKDQNSLEGKMLAEKKAAQYVRDNQYSYETRHAEIAAQIAFEAGYNAALSTHPTKQLYEAVEVEGRRYSEEQIEEALGQAFSAGTQSHIDGNIKTPEEWATYSMNLLHSLSAAPTRSTQVQEGEVERLKRTLEGICEYIDNGEYMKKESALTAIKNTIKLALYTTNKQG